MRAAVFLSAALIAFFPHSLRAQQSYARPQLLLQNAHTDRVRAIAFSPDGRVLASGSSDQTVKLWEVATGALLRPLTGHTERVESVSFSSDGRLLASAGGDKTVRVWDVETGSVVRTFSDSTALFRAVVFSPDGRMVAAAADEKIILFETNSGTVIRKIDPQSGWIHSLAFSPDGSRLVSGSQSIKLWDVTNGKLVREFPLSNEVARSVAFSPDGKRLAAASSAGGPGFKATPGAVNIWETDSGKLLHRLQGHAAGVLSVTFSSDGQMLASAGEDKGIRLWDAGSGVLLRTLLGHGGRFGWVYAVRFSPGGELLASAGEDHTIRLWRPGDGSVVRILEGHNYRIESVAFSPRGKTLAAGGLGLLGHVELWETTGGQLARALTPAAQTSSLADEQSTQQAVGQLEEMFRKLDMLGWEITSAQTEWEGQRSSSGSLQQVMAGLAGTLRPMVFSPDGKLLVTGTLDRRIHLWDAESGTLRRTLTAHSGLVKALAFSNDSSRFASAGEDKTIKMWNASNGYLLGRIDQAHSGPILAIALSPDGKLLASSASKDQVTKLWDTENWILKRTIDSGTSYALAFTPDGRHLLTGGSEVRRWDTATGSLVSTFEGKSLSVTSLDLSFDGSMLAAGTSSEGSAQLSVLLWDVATGKLRHTMRGHSGPIWSVSFSPDGKFVASGGDDATIKLWENGSGTLLATASAVNQGKDWLVTTPDGLFDGSPEGWSLVRWRFSDKLFDTVPVEAFFNEYYYPGLLADVLADKNPKAARDIQRLDRRQARVKLTLTDSNSPSGILSARSVKIGIEVTENSTGGTAGSGSGARDVRLFRNGSLVKVWRGDVLKGESKVRLEATVPIVAGENRLTAYAFNRDNIKSSDATVIVKGAESLRRKGIAYILAVGVNQYANSEYNLNFAVADAQAFAEEMKRQQTKLDQYERVEIISLNDKAATKGAISKSLADLSGKTQPEDAVIVYFAGHGTAQGNRFYLIPHDLGYSGARTQLDAAGLQNILTHSISDEELERAVETIDAGQLLLVIDACNSGQALEAEEKRRGPMNSKGLAQLAYEKGMYILTAAQSYQAALEAAKLGHGFLTYALVEEGLKTASADDHPKDGQVLLREWLDFATARVPEMQLEKIEEQRKLGRELGLLIKFVESDTGSDRNLQRPRVFYRREPESSPLVIARP
ncbi:MAG TPA: caspase family protein [Pyrinomonadaceae bacterium]